MAATDPSYPLLPLAYFLSVMMLSLVMLTSFVRQTWNRGVVFLCFWVLAECLTGGVDCVIWSDNAALKFYVYCDIGE